MEAQQRGAEKRVKWIRRGAIAIGVAIAFLALLLDDLTGARRSFGSAQLLLLLVGLTVIAVSVAGSRTPAMYRATALLLLNTLIALAGAELASALILLRLTSSEQTMPLMGESPYFASVPWSARYWEEFSLANKQRYEPYLIWRHEAYSGSLIVIGDDGVRRTPGAQCKKGAFTVLVFGGSLVWGVGAPDSLTIPFFIQTELSRRRPGAVCVRNLGELGYVSTQEVIVLIRELQLGRVPHLAIFLNGGNDAHVAYKFGEPGVHFDYENIKAKMEGPKAIVGARAWLASSNLYKLAVRLSKARHIETRAAPGYRNGSVAENVLQVYRTNQAIIRSLARQYGFTPYFFWQPIISASNKRLTADEQRIASAVDPAYARLFRRTYDLAKAGAGAAVNFYYLGDVFDDVVETVYIDPVHVTPLGNSLLAKRIVTMLDFSASAERRKPGR